MVLDIPGDGGPKILITDCCHSCHLSNKCLLVGVNGGSEVMHDLE